MNNIYQFWKSEVKNYGAKGVSIHYYNGKDTEKEWSMTYKDTDGNVLTCKNVEGAFMAYYRTANEAKSVGEGDIVMYVNENGKIEIDPNDSVFKDIRQQMSDVVYDIIASYAGNAEKRAAKVRVKDKSIER